MSARTISRRHLMRSAALAPLGLLWPRLLSARPDAQSTLVCIFLRGGADGLSLVPPYAEGAYHRARPSIALARPGRADGAVKLDARFALHPRLAALKPAFDAGELAVVHAVGWPEPARSHFEAQDYLEAAVPGVRSEDGWLGRCYADSPLVPPEALRAIAFADRLPRALRGIDDAVSIRSLKGFSLNGPARVKRRLELGFQSLYANGDDAATRAGRRALSLAERLRALDPDDYQPRAGVRYPERARALRELAQVIKADVGVELAWIDVGGWDTHQAQGNARDGRLAKLCSVLGDGLAAFRADLGARMQHTTVLVMSEFGRTVHENGTGGSDHGHGGVMLLLGGPIRGRKVYGAFPGLEPDELVDGRDLAVTTDFRAVLAEVARKQLGQRDLGRIFPGYTADPAQELGLLRE